MHLLFAPNHVQLVTACYPPSSALLTSGPDYRPNTQELSRLTYFASNRPGKVNKLGGVLEKRAKVVCRKAQAGNMRARASLLITLNIFKALATECRRDISLLSPSLLATVAAALDALPSDLEVSATAASVFTAWTTYTNGQLIGVDSAVTQDYLSALRGFSRLSGAESKSDDHEIRNRTRLIGLAALKGAVNSEALYNDSVQFRVQVSAIVRPLLVTLLQSELSLLNDQAVDVKEHPNSPYLEELRARPAIERRAASIHMHVDGDKGPSMAEVANASLQALYSLLEHSNGAQLGQIMKAALDSLEVLRAWDKLQHCCWFAQKASEWSQYQYRYAVPTWLVERLLESQDAPTSTSLHNALAAMVTTVFNSPTPLVNLSTSDIVSNLITLILRRVSINPEDPLLPALVECIASLGSHVYYSDQIQDLAGDLISRLVVVEVQGVNRSKGDSEQTRSQAIRCLLAGLLELMNAATKDQDQEERKDQSKQVPTTSFASSADAPASVRASRRSRVSPDTWQDTLSLLCDRNYAVRADYSEALVSYLQKEIRKRGDTTDEDGVKRVRPLVDGPIRQANNINLVMYGDSATRFLNAIHAYVFILATSTSSSASPTPMESSSGDLLPAVNVLPATPVSSGPAVGTIEAQEQSQAQGRRSSTLTPRARKASVVRSLLDRVPTQVSPSAFASASDYAHILAVLTAAHEQLPIRGLLTGVPMLLALDGATKFNDLPDSETWLRWKTIKEVIARIWALIAKIWDSLELAGIAQKALRTMPQPSCLPPIGSLEGEGFHSPRVPVLFSPVDSDSPSRSWTGVDPEAALMAIVSSHNAQEATGLDRQGLLQRFAAKWTPDSALKESVERPSNFDGHRGQGISPLLKISPALMQVENLSLQSLARSTRGVGVTDLREAIQGRGSMSNSALVTQPSISTLDHTSSVGNGDGTSNGLSPFPSRSRKKPAANGEVRDVLNKLGIGKQPRSSLLKSSFPPVKKTDSRSNVFTPPYSG